MKDLDQAALRAQSKTRVAVPVGAGASAEAQTVASSDGSTPHPVASTVVADVPAADGAPREVHKWAQSGPRNQPKRPPKSKR